MPVQRKEFSTDEIEKMKIKSRFKTKIETANTVGELKKCIKILSRHVFNEQDGE